MGRDLRVRTADVLERAARQFEREARALAESNVFVSRREQRGANGVVADVMKLARSERPKGAWLPVSATVDTFAREAERVVGEVNVRGPTFFSRAEVDAVRNPAWRARLAGAYDASLSARRAEPDRTWGGLFPNGGPRSSVTAEAAEAFNDRYGASAVSVQDAQRSVISHLASDRSHDGRRSVYGWVREQSTQGEPERVPESTHLATYDRAMQNATIELSEAPRARDGREEYMLWVGFRTPADGQATFLVDREDGRLTLDEIVD